MVNDVELTEELKAEWNRFVDTNPTIEQATEWSLKKAAELGCDHFELCFLLNFVREPGFMRDGLN